MRIRPIAIIFDYGNVLSSSQLPSEVDAMADILNLPSHEFQQRYWKFRLAYDGAALDPTTYWTKVAERPLSPRQIESLNELDGESWTHPAAIMPDWARRLHQAGLRTALLSNMPLPIRDHVQRAAWLPPFDASTFSCDVRLTKPSPEIYKHCLDAIGVVASEALFLDDRPENIEAAQALGIHALLFSNARQLASDLDSGFDIPVPLAATLERADEKDQ